MGESCKKYVVKQEKEGKSFRCCLCLVTNLEVIEDESHVTTELKRKQVGSPFSLSVVIQTFVYLSPGCLLKVKIGNKK